MVLPPGIESPVGDTRCAIPNPGEPRAVGRPNVPVEFSDIVSRHAANRGKASHGDDIAVRVLGKGPDHAVSPRTARYLPAVIDLSYDTVRVGDLLSIGQMVRAITLLVKKRVLPGDEARLHPL